jgi:hypothetical protein
VTLSNTAGANGEVEVRGHASYTKTLMQGGPYPPGSYQYAFSSHDDNAVGFDPCGDSACDQFKGNRFLCVSGAGDLGDGVQIDHYWDVRTCIGSGTFYSVNQDEESLSDEMTQYYDGQEYQINWGGGFSGTVTNQPITYKLGAWKGAAGAWVATTSTAAF